MLQETRRDFLKVTGLAAGTLIMPQLVLGRSKPSDKPNILVIMSDEHASRVPLIVSWPARWKGRYKYVYHTPADAGHPAERELYDLMSDPGEFNNLAGEERYKSRIDVLHAALVKEVGEHPDRTEQRCRAECSKGYTQRNKKQKQNKT